MGSEVVTREGSRPDRKRKNAWFRSLPSEEKITGKGDSSERAVNQLRREGGVDKGRSREGLN